MADCIAMQGWYLGMWQLAAAAPLAGPAAALEEDDACRRQSVHAALCFLAHQQLPAPAVQANQTSKGCAAGPFGDVIGCQTCMLPAKLGVCIAANATLSQNACANNCRDA